MLSQAAVYVACAPKSNAAYAAIDAALEHVRNEKTVEVPRHLQDGHYKGAKRLGKGVGYQYAHDHEDGYVSQEYGPPRGSFYHPTDRGAEAAIKARLEALDARDRGVGPEGTS